jgi:hypothetical protein
VRAVFKIPRGWRPSLADRTALYPALHLRWTGHEVAIAADPAPSAWRSADLRVLILDGPLQEGDRALIGQGADQRLPVLLAAQAGLSEADAAFASAQGCTLVSWRDGGPLATPAPARIGERVIEVSGLAARRAEDRVLAADFGLDLDTDRPLPPRRIVVIAEDAASLEAVWPALLPRRAEGVTLFVAFEQDGQPTPAGAVAIPSGDPGLIALFEGAEAALCLFPRAAPDDPRPGQWARSALFAGAPVIAASHPSLDGIAHLCVLDDYERGLELYARFPIERLKAAAAAQAELEPRLETQAVARTWLAAAGVRPPSETEAADPPTLVVLIDIHQDLDVLLPVLLALKARGELRLRLIVSEYLIADSPRIAAALAEHGLAFDTYPREELRAGSQPSLDGASGVMSGADTTARAHKAGHTLATRARELGMASFTLQHGMENIGLTYKDHLHGEDIRFGSDTIFIWGSPEGVAPWAPRETRVKVAPVGSPKTPPAPAAAPELSLGHWSRIVGVFENLHWHRFSELYLERCLEDLAEAARGRPDTLFLIKPHHAGRWLSRRPERLRPSPNILIVDPTDSAWEPHTAPALMTLVDLVLTTPSTVALDAARTGRPVAVLGYDLDLPLYEPLPIIRRGGDLEDFLDAPPPDALLRNEAFLKRTVLPGRADHRIAAAIAGALRPRAALTIRKRRLLWGAW